MSLLGIFRIASSTSSSDAKTFGVVSAIRVGNGIHSFRWQLRANGGTLWSTTPAS